MWLVPTRNDILGQKIRMVYFESEALTIVVFSRPRKRTVKIVIFKIIRITWKIAWQNVSSEADGPIKSKDLNEIFA